MKMMRTITAATMIWHIQGNPVKTAAPAVIPAPDVLPVFYSKPQNHLYTIR